MCTSAEVTSFLDSLGSRDPSAYILKLPPAAAGICASGLRCFHASKDNPRDLSASHLTWLADLIQHAILAWYRRRQTSEYAGAALGGGGAVEGSRGEGPQGEGFAAERPPLGSPRLLTAGAFCRNGLILPGVIRSQPSKWFHVKIPGYSGHFTYVTAG